jgi:hypothetical protein
MPNFYQEKYDGSGAGSSIRHRLGGEKSVSSEPAKQGSGEPKRRKPDNYVNNREFFEALVSWQGSRKVVASQREDYKESNPNVTVAELEKMFPFPPLPDVAVNAIWQITERYATKLLYRNRPYREDMISEARMDCIRYAHSFNAEKSQNPFAYFTQFTKNAFTRTIIKERKQEYIKCAALDAAVNNPEFLRIVDGYGEVGVPQNEILARCGAFSGAEIALAPPKNPGGGNKTRPPKKPKVELLNNEEDDGTSQNTSLASLDIL